MTYCPGASGNVLALGLFFLCLVVPSTCVTGPSCSPKCQNGGTCLESKCVCPKTFTGRGCEIAMDKYLGIDHVWLPSVKKVLQDKVGIGAINPGDTLFLTCSPSGAFGSYTTQWTLNGTLLNTTQDPAVTIYQWGQLSILNVAKNRSRYEGVYQCRISNEFGTALGSMAQVKVKVRGSFIENASNTYNVTINKKLALKCPQHTYSHGVLYRWINVTTKRNVNFPKPRVMTSPEDGTLYFTHVTEDDIVAVSYAKGIQCSIRLAGQEIASPVYSGVIYFRKMNVSQAFETTFFKKPPSTTFFLPVDGVKEFRCFPSGRSPVSMIWVKDSAPITSNNNVRLLDFNRTMRITKADRSVEGRYSYKTENPNGAVSLSGMAIRVIYPTTEKHYFQQKETLTLECMKSAASCYPAQWYYNGATIDSLLNSVFHMRGSLHSNCSFTLKSAMPRDSGVFQCFIDGIAASLHYVYVIGSPLPPISLTTTNCSQFSTILSWNVKTEPKIAVSSFIIEIGNNYEVNVYKQLKVVKELNARNADLTGLSPWANITFRMKAVNDLGSSLTSRPSTLCTTPPSKPTTVPEGLKAVPLPISGGMNITWKVLPLINWNGVECVIRVYHKRNNVSSWQLWPKNSSCYLNSHQLAGLGNYQLINIKIQVQNEKGYGPNSSVVTAYSGQNAPKEAPKNLRIVSVTPYSVTLQWDELMIIGGSVDEYLVTEQIRSVSRQRRRSLNDPDTNRHHKRSPMRSRRSLNDPDPNCHYMRSFMRSRHSLNDQDTHRHYKRSSMRSRHSLNDQDTHRHYKRSSMRSRHSLNDQDTHRHCKRLSMRSRRSLNDPDPNHDYKRSSMRSRHSLNDQDPNRHYKRSSMRSRRSLNNPDPNHDYKRLSIRSRHSLNNPDPNRHYKRSSIRSRRSLNDPDPNRHFKRSSMRSRHSLNDPDPNHYYKRLSMRSRHSLNNPDPNHDYKRSSMRSRRSLNDQDPNRHYKRSSIRSRRSLNNPDPNHDYKRLSMRSRRSLNNPDPNRHYKRSSIRSRRSLNDPDPNRHFKRSSIRSRHSLNDQDPNRHFKRSSMRSRHSLNDPDPNHYYKRSSLRSRHSLNNPDPNHDYKRSSMRSRHSLNDQDPNHDYKRSSMRSRHSLNNPDPHHDYKRSSMRSRRSLNDPDPNHYYRRSSMRSRGSLQDGLSVNVRLISSRDKRRLVLANLMRSFPTTKHKAEKILHRLRRQIPRQPLLLRLKGSNVTIRQLQPYTQYTFAVQAVNSGGLGPSATIPLKTLDSVDSSYIITVVVTSETFTPDFQDKTSLKYRNLSDTLTTGIRLLFQGRFWLRSLELLTFRNGSVVSELQMVAATPDRNDMVSPLLETMYKDYFSNFEIEPRNTTIVKEPTFQQPNISVSNEAAFPGATIEFECLGTGGPRSPVFTWVKDRDKPVVPDVRHKIFSDDKKSFLTIRKLTPDDGGNYTCVTSKGNQNRTSSGISVTVLPVITIVPRTLTKNEGESATISCNVQSGNTSGMDMQIITQDGPNSNKAGTNSLTLKNLRITDGSQKQVVTYQCVLIKNSDIKNPVSRSEVAKVAIVRPRFPKCLKEVKDDITWSTTAAGQTDIQACAGKATGQVSRRCLKDQEKWRWGDVNVGNCTSPVFQRLQLEAEAIVSDYKPSLNSSGLLQELNNATRTSASEPEALNGGDLDVTVSILSILVNNRKIDNSTDKDQQNFVEICSNILEPVNTRPWIQFENQRNENSSTLWNRLVGTINDYGLQLTNHISSGKNKLVTTKNIAMRMDKIGSQSEIKNKGLEFKHEKSSIFLPPEIFSGNTPYHRVVSLAYKTLNNVMRLRNTTNNQTQIDDGSALITSNTTMVSSTVRPQPTKKLKNNVKIVVQNTRDLEPVPHRTCVFWREGLPSIWKTDGCSLVTSESDKHVTTCECDHLTIFASLMDPYGGPLPDEHRKALELISTIGCAISLFAILVTIAVMAFFWQSLKGPRTIVLMNICVAIAVVCILVISEGTARVTTVGCTVMAVLLHYFLLAVFCWMLCEGVLLYLILVKVIGAKVEEKVKFFFIFGWGFPAFIIGISLAATQTKGYGYYGIQTACWLAVDNGLIWAFVAPAIVILLINLVVLVLVIRQMMGTRHVQSKSRDVKVRMGVKATAVLLPLLGITWLFGLLAFNSATIAFKYLFAIFNSLQGLMIFIFHCLLNKQVQDAVTRKYQKYTSTDSAGTGSKDKNLQTNKKNEQVQSSARGNVSQNEYEMNTQKRNSTVELLPPSSGSAKLTTDSIALRGIDEIQIHKPKVNPSKQNKNTAVSKANDGYQGHRDSVDHKHPLMSDIQTSNCVVRVENDSKAGDNGLLNCDLEEDKIESMVTTSRPSFTHLYLEVKPQIQDSGYGEATPKEIQDTGEEKCKIMDSGLHSPPYLSSTAHYGEVKPQEIQDSGKEKYTATDVGPLSPPLLSSPYYREGEHLGFQNQMFDVEDEKALKRPDEDKKETPPSTPPSFDFGPLLSGWSTDSQRSSPSISNKDFQFGINQESDCDNTVVMSSADSSDDDNSVASYTVNAAIPKQPKESSINSNDLSQRNSNFGKYLPHTDDTHSINEDHEPCVNGIRIFDSGSESSSSGDEFVEYDLVDAREKPKEQKQEGDDDDDDVVIVFKGLKKIC